MSAALNTSHIVFDVACPECGCTTEGIFTNRVGDMRTSGESSVTAQVVCDLKIMGCTVCDWLAGVTDD